MAFHIIRNDLALVKADVLVSTTSTDGTNIGGLEERLFKQAGVDLKKARDALGLISYGEVKKTKAFNLKADYVFHIAMRHYHHQEDDLQLLEACYVNALELALKLKASSIAFPLIGTGMLSYPKEIALKIAIDTIKTFLVSNDIDVYLGPVDFYANEASPVHKLTVSLSIIDKISVSMREQNEVC